MIQVVSLSFDQRHSKLKNPQGPIPINRERQSPEENDDCRGAADAQGVGDLNDRLPRVLYFPHFCDRGQ